MQANYPETRKDTSVTDEYFGTKVTDPYRWLETDTAEEVKDWVKRQNEHTYAWLAQVPYREKIKKRITALWNYEKYSAPFTEGAYSYYFKNDGLQNQSVLYRQKGADGKAEIFLDPNSLSKEGIVSLSGLSFSKDGNYAAYSLSKAGADWQEIFVMDARTGELTQDKIADVKFSGISWKENDGFYYSRYTDAQGSKLSGKTENHKLFYHKLGTPVNTDVLVFGSDAKPRRYIGGSVTEDGRYLIISAANTTYGNELYIQDLSRANAPVVNLVNNFSNEHDVVESHDGKLFIITNLDAPNKRLVTVDASSPAVANWKTMIPETENVLSVTSGGGKLFAFYLKDAVSQVIQYSYNGNKDREISLPGVGTASGLGGKEEEKELYYSFTSYVTPSTIYKYDPATGNSAVYKKPDVKFDFDQYESRQVFYTSKDGTRIPMILTYKKGIALNGKNPTLLYGYGGFNISLTPAFSPNALILLENGGIFAVANIRGGGEYGEKWHAAGTKLQKQNVFDDFIAAANYLIENKYTSSDFLAISGGSNGGLLVGAVMTQQPGLARVAFPAVGVLDMLRYHKFTAGAGWTSDYGNADESREMFEYLLGYSPLHHLKKGTAYPATMVTTGDHDDRVVPAHSFKFAATLQEMHQGSNPVLIRIDTDAGHGAGKPVSKVIEENADKWAFMFWNMGIKEVK